MKTHHSTLLFMFLFLGIQLQAQNHLFISGKIIDKKTGEPISYAHVGIPEKGIGTTTAYDGTFYFKVPKYYDQSSMIVSFIGYKTFRFPINQIKEAMTIELETSDNELVEIVVMEPTQVEDIIRRAVKNIPKNYPTHGTKLLGFYRESRTDDSLRHTYMAEGVLNIYKKSYKSKKEGYVSLVQGRRINLKNPLDTIIRSGFTSGHMAAHRFDIVQNREDFLQEIYFPVYKYWIEGMTTYNDKPVYIIGFDKDPDAKPFFKKKKGIFSSGKDSHESGGDWTFINLGRRKLKYSARMKGRIFIEKESYAIIKSEFEIRPEGLRKQNDYPLYSGSWKGNSYVVNYRKVGKKWYFSDAVREGDYGGGGMYSNEVKITEINTEKAEPLPYLDRISRGSAFARMTGKYDVDFWKNYNTTPFSLELAKSVQQIENAEKANEAFDHEYMLLLQTQRDSIKEVERLKAKEEAEAKLASGEISEVDFQEIIMEQSPLKRKKKKNRNYSDFKSMFGTGPHFISSQQENLSLTLLSDDENPTTIMSLTDNIGQRDFEIISHWDWDIFFRKNLFVRFGSAWDYGNSIYKGRDLGIGAEINLSKQRPFFVKAIAQYSNLKYARKLGSVDSDYGKFRMKGKFKGDSFFMYYGNRTHNLKLSGELSIELNPGQEFYVRGSYLMPFHHRADIWIKERKQFSRRKRWILADDKRVNVLKNDAPFIDDIMPDPTFSISVGLLFK